MKKTVLILFSLLLMAGLLFSTPGKVQAFDWTPPVVTPVFGDNDFNAVPTAVSKLPGIVPNENGIILPAGFPEGTAQFGGDALVVKNLIQGSIVKACFSMPPASTEWTGSIHQWNGSKWVKLSTTISQAGDEALVATACTEIYGDGTYALIMGYTGTPEPKGLPVCSDDLEISGWGYWTYFPNSGGNPYDKFLQWIDMLNLNISLPVGTPVTYSIFGFTPSTSMQGALTRTSTVSYSTDTFVSVTFPNDPATLGTFPLSEWILSDQMISRIPFTFRVILPNCYKDFSNPFFWIGSDF